MSFFDFHFSSKSETSQNKGFFKKFTPLEENSIENFHTIFSCPIIYWKKNGTSVSAISKIIDGKFVIFKKKKPKKYLDLREMYRLGSSVTSPSESKQGEHHFLLFMKNKFNWVISVETNENFITLHEILKKFCVLSNFSTEYETLQFLGKGHFAEVYSVLNVSTRKKFAAKIMQKTSEKFKKSSVFIKNEIEILRFLPENSCIVKLFEIYEEDDRLILILELMEGKSLEKYLKNHQKLTEHQIFNIFYQILKGISFLHSCEIMHRDIKPENILFLEEGDSNTLKIADFSLAEKIMQNRKFKLICGTPGFMAPEIFASEGYDEKIDIYSLGLVLYALCTGKSAFKGKNNKEVVCNNKSGKIKFTSTDWEVFSPECKKTVKYLLRKNPLVRVELIKIFQLKWVKKYQELNQDKSMKLDDSISTNDRTIMPLMNNYNNTKEFSNKKSNFSEMAKTLTETKTKNIIEKADVKKKRKSEFIKNATFENNENIPIPTRNYQSYQSSSFLSKMPSFLESYKINSFLINSKSITSIMDRSNSRVSSNSSVSVNKLSPSHSPLRKMIFFKSRESFMEETQKDALEGIINEEENYYSTRNNGDLDLRNLVPGLQSVVFKKLKF